MHTLEQAQEYVKKQRGRGVKCPCCQQNCKVYRRPITKEMASCLFLAISIYMREQTWIEGRRFKKRGGDYAKLAYWGLIEFLEAKEGSVRQSGPVRPTRRGVLFAQGKIRLPSHALIYNKTCIGFDRENDVGIRDVRGFDYDEVVNSIVGVENLPWP